MPIAWTIDIENECIRWDISGHPNRADFEAAVRAAVSDPSYRIEYDAISDYTNAEPAMLQSTEVAALARHLRETLIERFGAEALSSISNRSALIAPKPVMFGMLRMFEQYYGTQTRNVRVFSDTRAAEQWLSEGRSTAP